MAGGQAGSLLYPRNRTIAHQGSQTQVNGQAARSDGFKPQTRRPGGRTDTSSVALWAAQHVGNFSKALDSVEPAAAL